MLTDYHTHTYRCGHAVGELRDYVESALAKGIGEIGLTDHLWLYWLPEEERNNEWAIQQSEYDAHYAEMLAIRSEYHGRINVRVAVEADYVHGHEDQLLEILSRYEYDFILGSVHFMDGWMIDAPEYSHLYREQRIAEVYRRYFTNLQRAARLGFADVLGHIDLPKKFGFLPEEDVTDIVGETLNVIAAAGVAVEISTAGLRKPIGEIYPSEAIVREMKSREIAVVLSSDAHKPEEVGIDYDKSIALLRSVGYDSLLTFEKRHPRTVPLG